MYLSKVVRTIMILIRLRSQKRVFTIARVTKIKFSHKIYNVDVDIKYHIIPSLKFTHFVIYSCAYRDANKRTHALAHSFICSVLFPEIYLPLNALML